MVDVGVLALQGDFAAHRALLAGLGVTARLVRVPAELEGLQGLILPGGESTAMLKLLDDRGFFEALRSAGLNGLALFGCCAGAILLARTVRNPAQRSLGFIDMTIARNAYGRQVDSFVARGQGTEWGPMDLVFIRAPKIESVGPGVRVLARCGDTPVLVEQGGRFLAATFHPELTGDARLHRHFMEMTLAPATPA